MSRMVAVLLVFILVCAGAGSAILLSYRPSQVSDDTLYQVSTLDSLMNGHYEQVTTVSDLLTHGALGLGTFTGLDGEMTVLDGVCYQATVDGTVKEAAGSMGVPFAQVAYFTNEGAVRLNGTMNMSTAENIIDGTLPTGQVFFVLRIDGLFDNITLRSVPKQVEPYPQLADVVANQTVFQYSGIKGTMVGIWTPGFASGISSAGFHFHFISEDHSKGGHVLGFDLTDQSVQWDQMAQYTMIS